MSESDSFEDSFQDFFETNETIDENNGIFKKLLSIDFEDESLLLELSTNEDLPQIVLNIDNYSLYNKSNDLYFDYVFGLTNLVFKLSQIEDTVIELWIRSSKQTKSCLLTTIFQYLPKCCLELCLPKIIDLSKFDQNFRKISFYEYICLNFCKLLVNLTPNHLEFVEPMLFENLLSPQSVCHLLASDVLCFLARISKTTPLCYHYCSVLMTISSNVNDEYLVNSTSLLNRLLPFLQVLEFEYLLKDYDIITHSRIWRHLNISRFLSNSQIMETFGKFEAIIDNGKPLTKYNINVLRDLFTTEAFDQKTRENTFELILKNFLTFNHSKLDCDFIDLLTVLTPKQLNEMNVQKIITKIDGICGQNKMDLLLIEKISIFLILLSNLTISVMSEKRLTKTISSSIKKIIANNDNFYAMDLILKAMTVIAMKSKHMTITTDCCKDKPLKQLFVSYLMRIKSNQLMDENEKILYLQEFNVFKLQTQSDGKCVQKYIKSSQICNEINVEESNRMDISMEIRDESNVLDMKTKVDQMQQIVKDLKQNQSTIESLQLKQRLVSILSEFNDFIHSLKDELNCL